MFGFFSDFIELINRLNATSHSKPSNGTASGGSAQGETRKNSTSTSEPDGVRQRKTESSPGPSASNKEYSSEQLTAVKRLV